MKTIFDKSTWEELIERIGCLNDNCRCQWGKMNVCQMVKHNTNWNNWMLGTDDPVYKQAFIGKVFGKMALRKMIKDGKPIDRNVPTSSQFKIREANGDLAAEKLKWISSTVAYENYDNPNFIHDFFGDMTQEQIGVLAYKHADHHLRQFGV
ncbi:MAG: DUF1569 domain-containing protein [Sphingobacteriaceae bacterium]